MPSSTSQSGFVEPRGMRTSSFGPTRVLGDLVNRIGSSGHGLPGLGRVVAVVQADAEDLVRPGDRRADALAGEPGDRPGGRPLGHDGARAGRGRPAKNPSSKSATRSETST